MHVRTLAEGQGRHFDASHIHDVVNDGTEPAVSLHAYSPSLPAMTRYDLVRGRLVDIRPAAQRADEGQVHCSLGPLVIERNVLEWRFDPRSDARIEQAAYDARVIVLCQEGYTSSLAADALRSIGIRRATDVVGGFAAWRAAGLPVAGA